jgi:non-specific serine/threonine protein kinase
MSHQLVTSILFDGTLALEWEDSLQTIPQIQWQLENHLFDIYKSRNAEKPALWMIVSGLSAQSTPLSTALTFWRDFARLWVHTIRSQNDIDEKRETVDISLSIEDTETLLEKMPLMTGCDLTTAETLQNIWNQLTLSFRNEMRSCTDSVDNYFKSLAPDTLNVDRINFHLVENRKNPERPFAFMATYSTRNNKSGHVRHLPLKHAFEEYSGNNDKLLDLLSTVNKISKKNTLLKSMVDSGELFKIVGFTPNETFSFLSGINDFEAAGILCRLPRWWKGSPKKVALSLSVGNKKPSVISLKAMLNFDAGLHLDGEELSVDEATRILEQAESLVFIKGKWVPVDLDSLQKTIDLFQEAKRLVQSQSISFSDAMRLLMGASTDEKSSVLSSAEITCGDWLMSMLQKMVNPQLVNQIEPSPELKATLRQYQHQGLNWLNFMHTLGFGVCLADDMGLGKTIQILALLQKHKRKGQTSLIIVPSSLLQNWQSEIRKFTPDLESAILHPQLMNNETLSTFESQVNKFDIVITTYGMLSRLSWLSSKEWFYVICDEAQAIKNPTTRQATSVKAIKRKHTCAVTGTPVENRLTDLWSIFDFINPGLLGSFNEFKTFAKSLNEFPERFGKLRKVVHPYILRRSKTDKSIISDLPEKVEMKTWCTLSKQQVVIYDQIVGKLNNELETAEGIKRKGLILSYLIKCKQICNHPDHYAGSGSYDDLKSGKFRRLGELCETIREKREKVLIFTQFTEIIPPLSQYLEKQFGACGLTLSGSTSVKKRKEMVELFQSSEYLPFFILSLKAGGVGLNLTEANHVIHFDRWWNPAVENQATDRAFRIGQKKNVMVHKFICKGTIEEKIDELIEDKKKLAGEIIPSGEENWITEFDNNQIKDMFKLTIGNVDD